MGTANCVQCLTGALQHQSHGRVKGLQGCDLTAGHGAGIGMGQHVCFFEHQFTNVGEVFQGGLEPTVFQPFSCLGVALFRPLPQGEKGFGAPESRTGISHIQDLFRSHEKVFARLRWVLAECAVPTEITAQMGQRNENFGRKRDGVALALVTHGRSGRADLFGGVRAGRQE